MKDYNYARLAESYDFLEENPNISNFNLVLDTLLKKFKVKKVLDITCGTGVQAIYLHKKGYDVSAYDYSLEMVGQAKKKYPAIQFKQADMRESKLGKFDAVISIFNAIGHLSKSDFEKAIRNISDNLIAGGIYIFDIFNLEFMERNFITYEFIDKAREEGDKTYVRFNNNKLDSKNGIMNLNQKIYIQNNLDKPEIINEVWDMQIYSSKQLKEMLEKNGFEIVEFLSMEGTKFNNEKSNSILTIARKK
jgi:SAM-dependent methyltransferase